MVLFEFVGHDIQLNNHVIEIDKRRYLYRGFYLITELDVQKQVAYVEYIGSEKGSMWFQESVSFKEISLIPLFKTKENSDIKHKSV